MDLLADTRKRILNLLNEVKNISPTDFETIVFEQMRRAAEETNFRGTIRRTEAHAFPDIIANKYFGVEVKMTIKDRWTSTGNSVLESLRTDGVERIYIMFGKLGGKKEIRYRLYQECLPEVSVTHSPRYRINMDLPKGKSIFDKIGLDYDILRKHVNPISKIKDYYRAQLKEGEELWWIDQESDDRAVSPIIRPFRSLTEDEKENFITDSIVLFPEIFGDRMIKFERPAAYLIANYNSVSANLRDIFTAGGRMKIKINGRNVMVSKLAYNLYSRAGAIEQKIAALEAQKLMFYWRCEKVEKNRLGQWKKIMDENFIPSKNGITITTLFKAANL